MEQPTLKHWWQLIQKRMKKREVIRFFMVIKVMVEINNAWLFHELMCSMRIKIGREKGTRIRGYWVPCLFRVFRRKMLIVNKLE
ncbi:MAG: hypothetical protein ACLUUO_09435 [Sellimonas intestinalis]